MKKVKLNIAGMHCGACATGIQMLVSGMDGVKSVFVDYDTKKADLEFDDSRVNEDQIFKAIADLGYKAELVS